MSMSILSVDADKAQELLSKCTCRSGNPSDRKAGRLAMWKALLIGIGIILLLVGGMYLVALLSPIIKDLSGRQVKREHLAVELRNWGTNNAMSVEITEHSEEAPKEVAAQYQAFMRAVSVRLDVNSIRAQKRGCMEVVFRKGDSIQGQALVKLSQNKDRIYVFWKAPVVQMLCYDAGDVRKPSLGLKELFDDMQVFLLK